MANQDPTHCGHCCHSIKSHKTDTSTGAIKIAKNGKVVLKNKNDPLMWECRTCKSHDRKNKTHNAYHEASFE